MLVVDDSAVARVLVRRALERLGVHVFEAGSIAEANAVESTTYDAALLDLELGSESGVALAHLLRAVRPALPIAFFTAGADASVQAEAPALGPVFRKPEQLESACAWVHAAAASTARA